MNKTITFENWDDLSILCMDLSEITKMWYNEVLERQVLFAWKGRYVWKEFLYYNTGIWLYPFLVNFANRFCLYFHYHCDVLVANDSWLRCLIRQVWIAWSKDSTRSRRSLSITPQSLCWWMAADKELWKLLDISHDKFIRTTDDYHEVVAQVFERLLLKMIFISEYSGWYSVSDGEFLHETNLRKFSETKLEM